MIAKLRKFDWGLNVLVLILLSISIVLLYSITYTNSKNLAIDQGIYCVIGLIAMFGLSFLNYRLLKGWSVFLYFLGIIGLAIVIKIGHSQFGATRWIDLKVFNLQPSEIFKLIIILVTAAFLSSRMPNIKFKHIFYLLILCGIPIALVIFQPDLGTAIVIFVTIIGMIFGSGLKRTYILAILGILLLCLPLSYMTLKDYQKQRLITFINPESDPTNKGYNITQAKITVGSGGIFGKGLGKGSQSELNFLPVAHTDFIFAGLAEVAGFVGSFVLVLVYTLLFYRVANVANNAPDRFGSLLALGIGVLFLFQFFINVGMNIGLTPVVGVPLPFVSYGGTSLITNLMAIGILQSIYSYKDYKKY